MPIRAPQKNPVKRDIRKVCAAGLALAAIVFIAHRNASLLGASTLLNENGELQTQLPERLIQKETCVGSADCKGPYSVCNLEGTCEPLPNPEGMCTQPQVLTYVGSNGRAKHTYCKNGCAVPPQGARCL